jgi:hypothetical protein
MSDHVEIGTFGKGISDFGTGSQELSQPYKIITRNFYKYEIKVKVTLDGVFLDIVEVKINKDFLSVQQRIVSKGFHDVEGFYK